MQLEGLKFGRSFLFQPGRVGIARLIARQRGLFWTLSVFDQESRHHTGPHVMSSVMTPKTHTADHLYGFQELICFIFSSLGGSDANMLNLFRAFQSDEGRPLLRCLAKPTSVLQ